MRKSNIVSWNGKTELEKEFKTLADAAQQGFKVADVTELEARIHGDKDRLYCEIKEEYGVNPNSVKDITRELAKEAVDIERNAVEFNYILEECIEPQGWGKGLGWCCDKQHLEALAKHGNDFAIKMIEYKNITSMEKVLDGIKRYTKDGRVYPHISRSTNNRIYYSEPNLIGMNKKMMERILRADEGKRLVSVDMRNQEPSILVAITGCKSIKEHIDAKEGLYNALMQDYLSIRVPIVCIASKRMTKSRILEPSEVAERFEGRPELYLSRTPDIEDTEVKGQRVYSIPVVVMMCPIGVDVDVPIRVTLWGEDNIEAEMVPDEPVVRFEDEGEKMLYGKVTGCSIFPTEEERDYFKGGVIMGMYGGSDCGDNHIMARGNSVIKSSKEIKELVEECKGIIKKQGEQVETFFGTKIPIADRKNINAVTNAVIQGSGSDVLAMSINNLQRWEEETGKRGRYRVLFTRHDEIIVEVPENLSKSEYTKELTDIFEINIPEELHIGVKVREVDVAE